MITLNSLNVQLNNLFFWQKKTPKILTLTGPSFLPNKKKLYQNSERNKYANWRCKKLDYLLWNKNGKIFHFFILLYMFNSVTFDGVRNIASFRSNGFLTQRKCSHLINSWLVFKSLIVCCELWRCSREITALAQTAGCWLLLPIKSDHSRESSSLAGQAVSREYRANRGEIWNAFTVVDKSR